MEHLEPNGEHTKVLRETFRCPEFKKDQWATIRSIMYDRRDTSIVASTGFGKSLIYQFPPVFLNQIAFVVSPLIALMQDQVQSLVERGIKATYFCSVQPDRQIPQKFGQYNVVYVTPESLLRDSYTAKQVQRGIKKVIDRVCMFAIDEAHVVHSWSDFRSEFKDLYKLRQMYPGIPIVTLTATCPFYVEKIINDTLKLSHPFSLRTTLNRANLFFEAHPKRSGVHDFLPYLQSHTSGNAIVYVITRGDAEKYAEQLNSYGIVCKPYHSELPAEDRKETLLAFRAGRLKIVVCTIAFGMGIDRRDVRLVVHYGMPRTIEGYYQEAGRAGRDNQKSKCVLFYSDEDYDMQCYFIENPNHGDKKGKQPPTPVSEEFKRVQYDLLSKMKSFTTSKKCRRIEMLEYLGAEPSEYRNLTIHDECCDNCKKDIRGQGSIPLKLMYEGIRDDNTFDFTNDLRKLLKCLNNHPSDVTLQLLTGSIPNRAPTRDLTLFGSGRDKSRDFWQALRNIAQKQNFYNQKLTEKGKRFIRNSNQRCVTKPTEEIAPFLKKKENVEFFWNGWKIESRPILSDEELMEIERVDRMLEAEAMETSQNSIISVSDDDDVQVVEESSQQSNANVQITLTDEEKEEVRKMEEYINSEEFDDEPQESQSHMKLTDEEMEEVKRMEKFLEDEAQAENSQQASQKRRHDSLDLSYLSDDFTPDEINEIRAFMTAETQPAEDQPSQAKVQKIA